MGYILALVGLALMVGLAGCGSAVGTAIVGMATIGTIRKRPEAFGTGMILSGVPGTQGLYGFVAFFLYNQVVSPNYTLFQGCVVFGAGLAVGLACFISGIYQGKVCANGISAIGAGHNVFGNTVILAAYPEFYAILSLVGAILMQALLKA